MTKLERITATDVLYSQQDPQKLADKLNKIIEAVEAGAVGTVSEEGK